MFKSGRGPAVGRVLSYALPVAMAAAAALAPTAAAADKQPRMRVADSSPRAVYLDSGRKARFKFELAGSQRRDLVIKAIRVGDGEVVRRWRRDRVEPGDRKRVTWNGKTRKGGYTNTGKHTFKVYERGRGKAETADAKGKKRFRFYKHRFPLRARHTYGDGFGAGRGHQGADVFARCGKRMRAARGGRVQVRSSHGSAGKYLVIDGHANGYDYVYMHMKRRGRPKVGERVRTGERIGYVGETGNASGCHLHFELWSPPGWYEGGRPHRKVKRLLKRWDGWS